MLKEWKTLNICCKKRGTLTIGLIALAAFIAFLFFTPPMKVETAEKLAKDLENNSDNNANKNLSGNFGYDALQNYNETRTNPAYSYLSDNIHYKD